MRDALIGTTLGLESGTVRVVAYDEQWPRLFEHAAAELNEALGPHALGIHHVGSTAIAGLSAKPILDVLVGIADFANGLQLVPILQQLGYEYRPHEEIPDRHYFRRGRGRVRTHHLSLAVPESHHYRVTIAFRDALRRDPQLLREYAELKTDLAARFPYDRESYISGKSPFVERVLKRFGLGLEIMLQPDQDRAGLAWQVGTWNRMSDIYPRELDRRFESVVDAVIARADLTAGESVLDLGTGTGAVAERAAAVVGANGRVIGLDVSADMLSLARQRATARNLSSIAVLAGRAESIPADYAAFDKVLASLSLMFVIDRKAAAREIARVLSPGGRFVASVWAGPDQCDIVRFQQTAGRFAGPPPIPGVGPGALADPRPFLLQLDAAGIDARVETETLFFDFPDFTAAWNALAGVTTVDLTDERRQEAKAAVLAAMYPDGDVARRFRNTTQFIIGRRRDLPAD